jgi:hypothetical protein
MFQGSSVVAYFEFSWATEDDDEHLAADERKAASQGKPIGSTMDDSKGGRLPKDSEAESKEAV